MRTNLGLGSELVVGSSLDRKVSHLGARSNSNGKNGEEVC